MSIKFDPSNEIIRLCIAGMVLEANGDMEAARAKFDEAWHVASDDYFRFIVAYHVARVKEDNSDKLIWFKRSLDYALSIDDENVKSAYAKLYACIAECYEALNRMPADKGPFYHGTKADLLVGELLTAGGISNYQPELQMNHIYFTANINGAGLAAALAKGEGRERVYIVEPTGPFENDPNVTDVKFPGNLTRSYRSTDPLRITGELTGWSALSKAEKDEWLKKIAENDGEIIN